MYLINKTKGVLLMVCGISCLTCGQATLKFLTLGYSPFQILLIRSLIAFPILLFFWSKNNSFNIFRENIKDLLILNGVSAISLILTIYSLSLIPLFQYSSLFFSSPFFIVIFSIFLSREIVDKITWFVLTIGFLGIVIVFNPTSSYLLELGSIYAVLSAMFHGLCMVLTSKISKINSPVLVAIWYTGTCCVIGFCGSFLSFLSFPFFSINDIFLFIIAAFLNIGANISIIRSFQYAQASFLAPLEYIAIPLSVLLGYLIWDQLPRTSMLVGSLLIIGSGFYIFKKEKVIPSTT